MFRFFLGFGIGAILTVYAFAFAGVGHGTYAPLVFVTPLIVSDAIPTLLLGPLLWAIYFLLIPQIRIAGIRIACTSAILSVHFLTGAWLAIEDPAFTRAVRDDRLGLLVFGLLLAITMSCLFYFAVRGATKVNAPSIDNKTDSQPSEKRE